MDLTTKSDDKKMEFLMTALNLFYQKGYEKTTIKDIIDSMGVSKGAFYHYFTSKEDIIVTISKEYAARAINLINKIAERKDLNSIEKMNIMIESINEYKGKREVQRTIIKGIFLNEENLKLERKIVNAIKDDAIRLFKDIINQGIEEGSFEATNSEELAEFMLYSINTMNSSIDELLYQRDKPENSLSYQEFIEKLVRKLCFFEEVFTRVLNIKEGSIKLKESYLKRFLK